MTAIEKFIKTKIWKNPKDLTDEDFRGLLDAFAADDLLFSNEAQFQLKLGSVLQSMNPNWKVKLEAVSIAQPSPFFADGPLEPKNENDNPNFPHDRKGKIVQVEKIETDIVIEGAEPDDNVAIELKYKNAQINKSIKNKAGIETTGVCYSKGSENIPLFSQGAANIGAHEFLEDVERLERLVYQRRSIVTTEKGERHEVDDAISYGFGGKTIAKGFAIIITNDKGYYEKGKSVVYRPFFFPDFENKEGHDSDKNKIGGRQLMAQIEEGNPLNWKEWKQLRGKEVGQNSKMPSEHNLTAKLPVKLCGVYRYQWRSYGLDGWKGTRKYRLKYLILTIPKDPMK